MEQRPTFYILDAFSLIFQVFHAIPEMTGPAGQPTQAVFGIFRDILNLLRDRKPDYLAAAFDGEGPVFRSEIYPEYKANRSEMPADLVPQIPVIRRVFEGFGVPVLVVPGMEADDIIATLARRGAERGLDVFICTADKDARQLISERIRILNLRKNAVIDESALLKEWEIRPDQVVDFLALTGDAVDNVPGVPGVGKVLASAFLSEFGTLEGLLSNVDKVKGPKKQQSLREHADTARRARSLVALRDDLDLGLDWDQLKITTPNVDALRSLCAECGFHGFLRELPPSGPAAVEQTWAADYRLVDTPELFDRLLCELKVQHRLSIDTETTDIDPLRAALVGISLCWQAGLAYYLPLRAPIHCRTLDPAVVLPALAPLLADPEVEKVAKTSSTTCSLWAAREYRSRGRSRTR
jgi:DNA polymerase-1